MIGNKQFRGGGAPGATGNTAGACGSADAGPGVDGRGCSIIAPVHCWYCCKELGEGDDPQVFLETFKATSKACQWPAAEWAQ